MSSAASPGEVGTAVGPGASPGGSGGVSAGTAGGPGESLGGSGGVSAGTAGGPGESLGGSAARVRVRPVTDDEAFLLGALHLQSLRRAGAAPAPGTPSHVQAFARSWQQRSADLPAWVAELDGAHVGMTICRVPLLPRMGRAVPELVALEPLVDEGAEAVTLAMVRAVVSWFGREGHLAVDVSPEVRLPPAVLDAARADVLAQRRISLPTRP